MKKSIVKWKVAKLKPHPRQAANFPDLSESELQLLADDIDRNGLQTPLEVLSNGTVVCGHQRLRAVKLLGWKEVDVFVNQDLASKGEAAIEQRLIEDNVNRRQLDPLEIARAYRRLRELNRHLPSKLRNVVGEGRIRDVLGERFGISGRSLDRLVRILNTPQEVQHAFTCGILTQNEAGRVAGLSTDMKKKIATEIRQGGDPKKVVQRRLGESAIGRACTPTFYDHEKIAKRFIDDLDSAHEQVSKMKAFTSRLPALTWSQVQKLKRSQKLIARLLGEPNESGTRTQLDEGTCENGSEGDSH